jgi:hypothetical protein
MRKVRGLPSQLPTIRGKRPSFSTSASKRTELDYDVQPGWVAPTPKYVDLEGLPYDGYGYTVIISGPIKKGRSKLRRQKSVREGDSQQSVLQKPKAAHRVSEEKAAVLDIAAVREVEVRESWHWPRRSTDSSEPIDGRSTASTDIEMASKKNGKDEQSWLRE